MQLVIDDLYNLFKGGKFVHGNQRYLRKLYMEPDDAYLTRLTWATYQNYQKKIINTYVGYVFHGKIVVDPPGPLNLERIARKLTTHALIGGVSYLLTIGDKMRVFNAKEVSEADGTDVYTIANEKGQWVIDTKNKQITGPNKAGEVVTEALGDGQFVECCWNEDEQSLIEDTACMNIELYNQKSQLQVHYDRGLFYFMYGPPLGKDQQLTSGKYVSVNPSETTPGVVQVSSAAAEQLRKEMQITKMEMAITVALEQEFADQIKAESGLAIATRKLDTNAIIASIAFAVQTSVDKAAAYYASVNGVPAQTLRLDPFIKTMEPMDEQNKYKNIIAIAGTELVTKMVQKNVIQQGLASELKPEDLKSLLDDIDTNGGRKIFDSAGVLNLHG